MGRRILYITTVGETMSFFENFITELVNEGNSVDIACGKSEDVPELYRELGCKIYPISCSRSPFNKGNITAIKEIERLISDKDGLKYDIVHCHTPIAAATTRLACNKYRKNGLKVIYTAHGFHFYKGAPLKNWILFYPVEKFCAHFTDILITINGQDYRRAKEKIKAKRVEYVPGVGLDIDSFAKHSIDIKSKRESMNLPIDAFVILSVGELNDNKNHIAVIEALASMKETEEKNIHYIIAGNGDNEEMLRKNIARLGLDERVHLLGFRKDVADLYKVSNLFVHPSFREGLPVSVMEAMAAGLAVICSNIRGCQDLVQEKYLFEPGKISSIKEKISNVLCDDISNAVNYNQQKVNDFSAANVNKKIKELYGL